MCLRQVVTKLFAAVLLGHTPLLYADINQFVSGLLTSGSPPFNVDDTSATDNNVRTFDYATYRVGYSITPTDPAALIKLTMGSFTLPGSYTGPALAQVAFFDAKDLPTGSGGCQNISLTALTAAQIAAGTTSGVTTDGQTIYCVQPANIGGNNLNFRVQIKGNVPNGATINAPIPEFSSTSNPTTSVLTSTLNGPVGSEVFYGRSPLTIRASPKWNLSKTSLRGGLFVPGSGPPGTGPGGVGGGNGFVFSWNIGIYALGSRKGLEALRTAGFTESWSDPDFPNAQLVTWDMQVPGYINTNITPRNCGDWQNQLGVLGNVFDNVFYSPVDYGNFNYTGFDAIVANGGTCQSTAVNQAAKNATFSLTNTDWSLTYYPLKRGTNPAAANLINPVNPDDNTNEWWTASKTILIWVPETDIPIPPNPNTQFLTNTANLFGTSISGQSNTEPVLSDNANTTGATRQLQGNLYKVARPWFFLTKPFGGIEFAEQDPTITGDSQVHQIAPNQAAVSAIQFANVGTTAYGPGQICDKIDNTRFTLLDVTNPAYVSAYPTIIFKDALTGISTWYLAGSPGPGAGGGPNLVWELGVNSVGTTGGTWSSYSTNTNEYVASALSGTTQADTGCGDADATWYPSVAALLAAGRTLQQVTSVRGKYASWPSSAHIGLAIPQLSRSTFAYATTDIGPGGGARAAGSSTIGTFSSNQARWDTGIPGLFDAAGVGRASDTVRFFQTEYIQITKSSPTNPNNTIVTPGAQITYALQVNATTSGSAHTTTIEVWDVLPAGVEYVAGSSTFGGAPLGDPVCASTGLPIALFPATAGPPASAAGQTPAGFKACKWVLLNQNVAKTAPATTAGNLPELRFRAAVALDAPVSPPALLNTSFADSPTNLFAKAVYGGAQVGFACVGGSNCFFSNWALSVAASPGIGLSKTVSANLVSTNNNFSYTLGYGAVGNSLASLRILDVLPYVGDGRSVASNYVGTLGLSGPVSLPVASAGPPATGADSAAVVLYTNNAPANINRDPYGPNSANTHHILNGGGTNSASNTNWCTPAQFTVGNCPSGYANVTGILVLPLANAPTACGAFGTVPCLSPGTLYQVTAPLAVNANTLGNVYSNDFRADSPSLSARAPGSNLVTTRVVAPDLVLTKTVSPSTVLSGSSVTYVLTPKNNAGANVGVIAASPAPVITVTDTLPANLNITSSASVNGGASWNCAASSPPSSVSCTYTGTFPVPVGAVIGNAITVNAFANLSGYDSATVVNTATISMTGQTENPTNNNAASASLVINPAPANLSVSKDNGTTTLVAGGTTLYTLTFSNAGPSPAHGALIKDKSSAGLICTFVTCTATTGGASCPTSMLPLGTPISSAATNFFSTGETIAVLPANSTVKLAVLCGVSATGL